MENGSYVRRDLCVHLSGTVGQARCRARVFAEEQFGGGGAILRFPGLRVREFRYKVHLSPTVRAAGGTVGAKGLAEQVNYLERVLSSTTSHTLQQTFAAAALPLEGACLLSSQKLRNGDTQIRRRTLEHLGVDIR